jgi:hypothetical protein
MALKNVPTLGENELVLTSGSAVWLPAGKRRRASHPTRRRTPDFSELTTALKVAHDRV